MKKGGSLDHIPDDTADSQRRVIGTAVTKSASFHSFDHISVGSPPRSPSLSPLFNRRTSEPPRAKIGLRGQDKYKAMIQVGSPVQSPLLASVMGGEQASPEWSQRKTAPPAPLPKPTAPRRSPMPTPRKQHIYEEPKNVLPANLNPSPQPKCKQAALSEAFSIKQLVENHRHKFPLRVRVYGGYLGSSDRETLSEGDILNIHFIKQAKLGLLRRGARKVKIPMNSALKFGILYDPENNIKGAMSGYNFQTANQLMAQMPLPKLVCTCEAFVGPTPEESVEADEVLLLREVQYGSSLEKFLLCTSLVTGKQKKLPENCVAYFSTNPHKVKLFLPSIIKHFPLPVDAMAFLPHNTVGNLEEPPFEDFSVLTICSCQKETTVVATPCLEQVEISEDRVSSRLDHHELPVFDIPVELPMMKVQILHKGVEDSEKLYVDTRRLFENYKLLTRGSQHAPISDSSLYYLAVREDRNDSGFQLVKPEAAYPTPRTIKDLQKVEDKAASPVPPVTAYLTPRSIKHLQSAEDKAASPISSEIQTNSPSTSETLEDEPIYDVPPDKIDLQPESDNIYQTPRNIPAFPGNTQTAPSVPQNIYQIPRSVLQLAEDQGQGAGEPDQHRRSSKGSSRYVAVTIGAPGSSKPMSPPVPSSPPSTPSPPPPQKTEILRQHSIPQRQTQPRSEPQWEHKYESLREEMESLKMDLKKVLKDNQELNNTVKGEIDSYGKLHGCG